MLYPLERIEALEQANKALEARLARVEAELMRRDVSATVRHQCDGCHEEGTLSGCKYCGRVKR